MALQRPASDVLREAAGSRHHEPFEKALGRAIRKAGGTYADYMDLISRVREKAANDGTDLREAATALASQP